MSSFNLGGGTGGVVCANVLGKHWKRPQGCPVDRKDSHVFMSSYPLLMINKRKAGISPESWKTWQKGVEFIHSEVKDPTEQSVVQTDSGYIEYDYLIISLGWNITGNRTGLCRGLTTSTILMM